MLITAMAQYRKYDAVKWLRIKSLINIA